MQPRDGERRDSDNDHHHQRYPSAFEKPGHRTPSLSSTTGICCVGAFYSSAVSMGFGYMRRRCTSNAKHSSTTSLGREMDRPVRFSIRRNRWRTVLGWQKSTSAAPRTDASLSCQTRNVLKSISRSWSGRSPKQPNTAPTVLTIATGALTAAVARMEPSNTATEDVESV